MFLRVNSILSMSISLAHLTMFFIVVIIILLIFFFSLTKILILNFLQWFCTDNAISMLKTRWFSNNIINFSFTFFIQLLMHFFFFMNFFSSLFRSTTRFTCMKCWLRIFCKLCLSEELNNLINIDRAVTTLYSHVELTHSQKAKQWHCNHQRVEARTNTEWQQRLCCS